MNKTMEILKKQELSIIKVDNIKALKEIEPKVKNLLSENTFIEPTSETINECETRRKNLKKGRSTLENLRREITGPILNAKNCVDGFANEFKAQISTAEEKQEKANNQYFDLEAWEKAKLLNTIEGYQDYLNSSKIKAFQIDAEFEIERLKVLMNKEIEKFENWKISIQNDITFSTTIERLNMIDSELNEADLDSFYDPDKAFSARETFFSIIDQKKERIEEADKLRIENEKKRLEAEKAAKEAEERRKKAEEKAKKEAEERKIEQQKENYENALMVLDSFEISIQSIQCKDKIRPYYTKLENLIEKDFGSKDSEIKEAYKKIKTLLDAKNSELIEIEREKQKEKDAEEKAKKEKEEAERFQAEKEKEKEKEEAYQKKLEKAKETTSAAMAEIEKVIEIISENYPDEKDFDLLRSGIDDLIFNFLKS